MLPEAGWLPADSNTNSPAIDALLPENYTLDYWEGSTGPLYIETPVGFPVFEERFVESFLTKHVGFTQDFERTLNIKFNQLNVFGVLLLDAFEPPAISIELFDFVYAPLFACDANPVIGTPTDFSQLPEPPESSFGSCEIGGATEWDS